MTIKLNYSQKNKMIICTTQIKYNNLDKRINYFISRLSKIKLLLSNQCNLLIITLDSHLKINDSILDAFKKALYYVFPLVSATLAYIKNEILYAKVLFSFLDNIPKKTSLSSHLNNNNNNNRSDKEIFESVIPYYKFFPSTIKHI